MSLLFDDLKIGLQQAIAYSNGNGEAKVTTVVIDPIMKYNKDEVRSIRESASMTQEVFADFLGVSLKTVESWENGKSHPAGPACRLMNLLSCSKRQIVPCMKVKKTVF